MRVEGSSGGGGAAVPHAENHIQSIHLYLSEASQPGSLPVKSSRTRSKVSTAGKINAFDGNLIYKIMERFPRNRRFIAKLGKKRRTHNAILYPSQSAETGGDGEAEMER